MSDKIVMTPEMKKWALNDVTRLSVLEYSDEVFFHAVVNIERFVDGTWVTFADEQVKVFASDFQYYVKRGRKAMTRLLAQALGPNWKTIMPRRALEQALLDPSEW